LRYGAYAAPTKIDTRIIHIYLSKKRQLMREYETGRRALRCFSDRQKIRTSYCDKEWIAWYSASENAIKHSSGSYSSLNRFRLALIQSISPDTGTGSAWKHCDYLDKETDKWLQCSRKLRHQKVTVVY